MHRRSLASPLGAMLLAASLGNACPTAADWPPDGVSLCTMCYAPGTPHVAPDGTGGGFIVWGDAWSGNYDVHAQRVTASGEIAPGWPGPSGQGLVVASGLAPQFVNDIAPDGIGGLLVVWFDYRDVLAGTTGIDIYAQRILADGSRAPGWAENGMPVTRAAGNQTFPVVLADGTGGAFVSWHDDATQDIHLQHMTAEGVPAPGWPENGLPVCTDPNSQIHPLLASDGAGGVLIAWGDYRDGPLSVYAHRFLGDGGMGPGWPANGARVALDRGLNALIVDGAGGAYLAHGTATFLFHDDYYLQRFTGAGTIAPGWPEGGVPVCLAPNERAGLQMVADGAGGALLVWSDFRDGSPDQIFASRFAPDGTLYSGWEVDGQRVTEDIALNDIPDLAPDGMGGAYLCWDKYTNALLDRVYVQHLTGAGAVAPGWPSGGRLIPTAGEARRPRVAADGRGGAIVAWEHGDYTVRALRLDADGPTPVQVALVSVEAETDRVRLEWFVGGAVSFRATVERRIEASEWQTLGEIAPDGTGRLPYEDPAVVQGTRYGYRLAYRDGADLVHSGETWVEVPALQFALKGIAPNPSRGDPVVSFSLVSSDPATLEVYDLHGRRVLARDLGPLEARTHEVRLEAPGALAAGVYTVRLRQGAHVATARAVVIR